MDGKWVREMIICLYKQYSVIFWHYRLTWATSRQGDSRDCMPRIYASRWSISMSTFVTHHTIIPGLPSLSRCGDSRARHSAAPTFAWPTSQVRNREHARDSSVGRINHGWLHPLTPRGEQIAQARSHPPRALLSPHVDFFFWLEKRKGTAS